MSIVLQSTQSEGWPTAFRTRCSTHVEFPHHMLGFLLLECTELPADSLFHSQLSASAPDDPRPELSGEGFLCEEDVSL
jgi:hypothetical protein